MNVRGFSFRLLFAAAISLPFSAQAFIHPDRDCQGPGFLEDHWAVISEDGDSSVQDRVLDLIRQSTGLRVRELSQPVRTVDTGELLPESALVISFDTRAYSDPSQARRHRLELLMRLQQQVAARLACVAQP